MSMSMVGGAGLLERAQWQGHLETVESLTVNNVCTKNDPARQSRVSKSTGGPL